MTHTISALQTKIKEFDTIARGTSDTSALQTAWRELFSQRLGHNAATSFAHYYKEMREKTGNARKTGKAGKAGKAKKAGKEKASKSYKKSRQALKSGDKSRRKQRGGAALEGAPIDSTMTPGLPVMTYGMFPIEAATDPQSIKDLDVYWASEHGIKAPAGYWPTVPVGMGSNKVGGARRTRRMQKGGSLMESLAMRLTPPFVGSAPPSALQTMGNYWSGASPAPSASPVDHAWALKGNSAGGMMNPGVVAPISNPPGGLATMSIWGSAN